MVTGIVIRQHILPAGAELRRYIGADTLAVALLAAAAYLAALAREVVTAHHFGASDDLDAFIVAFTIPVLFVNLVGGAAESTLIPDYIGRLRHHPREADEFAQAFSLILLGIMLTSSALLLLSARPLIGRLAPGFGETTLSRATTMFAWLLAFVPLSGAASICRSLLIARRRFLSAAAAPALQPAAVIFLLLVLGSRIGVETLVVGTLLGAGLVLVVSVLALRADGFTFLCSFPSVRLGDHTAALGSSALLLLGGLVYHMNTVVVRLFASTLPEGSVAALHYAQYLSWAVVSVVAFAVTTVEFPRLSALAAAGDYRSFRDAFRAGLRKAMLLILPFSIGLILFSDVVVGALFERGSFTAQARVMTAQSLVAFAAGLVPLALTWYTPRALFALKMITWATILTPLGLAINGALASALVGRLQHTDRKSVV